MIWVGLFLLALGAMVGILVAHYIHEYFVGR